ncbi:MAG: acylphosphatase [Candidatus Diapherotrites archaeon]
MKTFELIIEGNVQRVGYRNSVSQIAFDLGLNGSIENLPDGRVKIIVQGKEEQLNEFSKRIRIKEWPIAVKSIKEKEIKLKEKFTEFKIVRGHPQNELSERADEAVIYMQKMYGEIRDFRNESKSHFTVLGNRVSKGVNETRLLRKATNVNFNKMDAKYDKVSSRMDKMSGKMDKVSDGIDGMADTLKQTNWTLKKEFGKLSDALLTLATKSTQK